MAREDPRFGVCGFPLPPLITEGYWKSPSNGGSEFLASQLSGISPPIPAGSRKINGVMGKNHRKLGINQQKKGISPTMIVLV